MNRHNNLFSRDFKPQAARRQPWGKKHIHLAAVLAALGATGALLWPSPEAEANRQGTFSAGESPLDDRTFTEALALPAVSETDTPLPALQQSPESSKGANTAKAAALEPASPEIGAPANWQEITVKSGDTLSAIFDRLALSPRLLHAVVHAGDDAKALTRIHPGQVLGFDIREGELHQLRHQRSPTELMLVTRTGGGFKVSHQTRTVEARLTHSNGTIDSSLYAAGKAAGLSDRLIMEMAGIFGWDVDFALDLREGDSFLLLYEERFLDGERLENGNIVAAEFVNRGKVFRAVRFADAAGHVDYYSPDGRSMRKAFLRSPVDFRRISSRFSRERYHPVLGKKRPHRGVDYAASTGTPIKASGDGKIIYRGWKGGYGRTVIIQHGSQISTLYGHMSRYQGGLKSGSRVKQGQIIGYVGSSGLATGPHLHYEFRVNGAHRNPLTVELPKAKPIPERYRAGFEAQSANLLSQLDVLKRTQLASAD